MNINDFPYEVLSKVLEEVTHAHIQDGPTFTFGLSQAPMPIQRASLQRYVRGPVPPELLKWDATSMIRSVCWKWHEWALAHAIRDVYVRRWKGGEVCKKRSKIDNMLTIDRGGQSFPIGEKAIRYTNLLRNTAGQLSTATRSPHSSAL